MNMTNGRPENEKKTEEIERWKLQTIASVFSRAECIFVFCPHREFCEQTCFHKRK